MTADPQTTRYRHRTPEVEAVQWTGANADALRVFCGPDFEEIEPEDRTENPDASAAVRESKHGTWRGLEPGYWVVKIGEEFYEESPADFAAQFEPVPSAVPAPATDRAGLRAELKPWQLLGGEDPGTVPDSGRLVGGRRLAPPAPVARATVLNEAAEVAVRAARGCGDSEAGQYAASIAAGIGKELRRLAVEARDGQTTQGDSGGRDALMRAHAALAERAGLDQAALARVRRLHDSLEEETDLSGPDDLITKGSAARRIATALDGWSPALLPPCGVEFEGGGTCAKPAGHRPPGSDDPHAPGPTGGAQQPKEA